VARPDPLDLAARALRHRDRTRRQVEERLERAGVDDDARQGTLETLERIGYVDDRRYAHRRAQLLADRGYGDEAIRQFLEAEGVPGEALAEVLEELPAERERADGLLAAARDPRREAARLVRRGFAPETVAEAVERAFADGGAEA